MPSLQRSNTKAPSEVRNMAYDYTAELAVGEIVISGAVAVEYNRNPPTSAAAGGDLQAASPTVMGTTQVACVITGGNWDVDYLVTFTAITSAGQIIPRSIYQYVGQT